MTAPLTAGSPAPDHLELLAVGRVCEAFPGATVETWEPAGDDLGAWAVGYAVAGLAVFPLRGKVPAIAKQSGGAGVLDATTDLATVARWWSRNDPRLRTGPGCNIGGRVPVGAFVLDVDPRNGGADTLAELEAAHGPLTATRTAYSGRGDGGRHHWFKHPGGPLSGSRLGAGLDQKTERGYVVLPPSIHPDTGGRYRWLDLAAPISQPPGWLVELLRQKASPVTSHRTPSPWTTVGWSTDSPADEFCARARWADVLVGWTLVAGDGEADGAAWRHPSATSPLSATIRHGLLFVYSTSTPLEPTEPQRPNGYTKFRAWAVLEHGGDLSAAARAVIARRRDAA